MLASLRKHVSSWTAKLILSILIVSFVFFWGIGDVFRRGSAFDVAHVGDVIITRTDLAHELQTAIKRLEHHTKQPITPQVIMETGLIYMILNEMVSGALLDNEAKRLGIIVVDHAVRQQIQNMPLFQDASGHFNRKHLQQLLADMNMTETKFVNLIRRDLARQTLLENTFTRPLTQSPLAPKALTDAIYQWGFSPRKVAAVELHDADMKTTSTPTDAELESFYNREGMVHFAQPEHRDITVLWVDPKAKAHTILIEPAQIKNYYEENQASFTQPEQRQTQEAIFKTSQQAQDFLNTVKKHQGNFSNLATKFSGTSATLKATRETLPPVLANAVFSTPVQQVSTVIEHEGQFYVFKVLSSVPGMIPPLSKVEDTIKKRLQIEHASQKLAEQVRAIEDDLAGGASLQDITKQYGMAMAQIKGVVAGQNNTALATLPEGLRGEVLNQALSLNPNETSPLWQVGTGEYALVHVDKVIPKHQPALAEIKSKVIDWWRIKQRKVQSEKQANELIQMVRENKQSLLQAAQTKGLVSRQETVNPGNAQKHFPPAVLKVLFDLKPGDVKAVYTAQSAYVIQLQEIMPVTKNSQDWNKLHADLSEALSGDIITAYLAQLRKDFKVLINESAIQSLMAR